MSCTGWRDGAAQLCDRRPAGLPCLLSSAAQLAEPRIGGNTGDLTLPETLDRCLDGIEAVFLVWTTPPAAVAPALERIAKHARRIVFLSAPIKTQHPLFQQPNLLRAMFEQIERLIETSGLQWTFLRPGMFAANALNWWAPQIRVDDVVRWPYLAAPTAPVDERDIAAVAVRALCEDGHTGAEYVLTGPQSLSQFEQVSAIGRVTGRSLRIEEISPDANLRTLRPQLRRSPEHPQRRSSSGQPTMLQSLGVVISTWRKDPTHRHFGKLKLQPVV